MSCNKKKYKDKISAMFALSQTQFVGNYSPKRNEKRFYFCNECNAWHLTSKDKKDINHE